MHFFLKIEIMTYFKIMKNVGRGPRVGDGNLRYFPWPKWPSGRRTTIPLVHFTHARHNIVLGRFVSTYQDQGQLL